MLYLWVYCSHVREVFFLVLERVFSCGDKGWGLLLKRLLSVGKMVFFFQEFFFSGRTFFHEGVYWCVFFVSSVSF